MVNNEIPSATLTDLEYAIHLIMTRKNDPGFDARVQAETTNITDAIERKHGVLNIPVDVIAAKHALKDETLPARRRR
jgi:hypothetical protein